MYVSVPLFRVSMWRRPVLSGLSHFFSIFSPVCLIFFFFPLLLSMSFYQRVMRVCVHFSSDVCRRLSTRDPRVRVLDFFFLILLLYSGKRLSNFCFFFFPCWVGRNKCHAQRVCCFGSTVSTNK